MEETYIFLCNLQIWLYILICFERHEWFFNSHLLPPMELTRSSSPSSTRYGLCKDISLSPCYYKNLQCSKRKKQRNIDTPNENGVLSSSFIQHCNILQNFDVKPRLELYVGKEHLYLVCCPMGHWWETFQRRYGYFA